MMAILRNFIKSIPTLILAFFLSVAVWISAVNTDAPIRQSPLSRQVQIERLGLGPDLVVFPEVPTQTVLTLSAPQTVWDRINLDRTSVRAWINLDDLGPGTHTVAVNAQSNIQPAKVVSKSPSNITITLEQLITKTMPVDLVR